MPEAAGRAVRGVGEIDYWPSGRIHAAEGPHVLLRQFARNVHQAPRPLLPGRGIPLVLPAAAPLASLYRSVTSYAYLAEGTIAGRPAQLSDHQQATRART